MSLRTRVLGLLVVALIPILAINLLAAGTIRRLAFERAEEQAHWLIHTATDAQNRVFAHTRQILESAAASPAVRGGDPAACDAHLAALSASVVETLSFILLDPTGHPLCSSIGVDPAIDFSDRSWFTRPLERGEVMLGDYIVSRVSEQALIVMGHPVPLPGGRGVLGAGIDLSWFAEVIEQATLPEGAQITVIDGEGTVLISIPEKDKAGATFGDAALLQRVRSAHDVGFVHGIGNDAFMVFSDPLSDLMTDVRLIATLPAASILAPARAFANWSLLLLAGTILLALATIAISLERWVIRPIGSLVKAFAEVSAGKLDATLSPMWRIEELQRVAHGFNAMTDALRTREQDLKDSELRFRGIFNATFQFIGLLDPDGTLLVANRTALDFGELRPDDVVGKPIWECPWLATSPETKAQLREAVARAAVGEFVRFNVDIPGTGGTVLAVDFSINPVRNDAGEVVLLVPEGRDISELQAATKELVQRAESTELLYALTSQTARDIDEQLQSALAAATERLGLEVGIISRIDGERYLVDHVYAPGTDLESGAEFLLSDTCCAMTLDHDGSFAVDRMGESDQPTLARHRAFALESYIGVEVVVRGRVFGTLSFSAPTRRELPFKQVDRDFVRLLALWVGSALERRRSDDALAESEERYRLLVESLTSGVVHHQADGSIMTVNRSAREILGLSAEQLLGQSPIDPRWRVVREDGSPFPVEERPATVARATGAPQSNVMMGVDRPDGTFVWLLVDSRPVTSGPGQPVSSVVSTVIDITDRMEAQARLADYAAELERSNRELEQFAYIASHDLREPLRVIAGYTQLLERRYADRLDDTGREFIGFAVEGVDRMRQLIDDLLTFSQVGSGEFAREPVELAEVVERVREDLAVAIEAAGAKLVVGELPTVLADAVQMRQLFQNLIANAVKFRGEDAPCIRVCAERCREGWRLSVTDNGIGIDPKFAERIFVIFQRLHTHDRYEGTGIGLALCKRIVDRHGGSIVVTSEEGRGSRFTVELPN